MRQHFGPDTHARVDCTSAGRLPMASVLPGRRVVDLDGTWSFLLCSSPEEAGGPLEGREWAAIEVPGCWTMQGFDTPQYTNVTMPFPGPPFAVPAVNPTGVYRREVVLPDSFRGMRAVLRIGGAESVCYVLVDGEPVGMGKDSRLDQCFELTGLVEVGRPFELTVVVVRWSDATYLEDQDHWYHAGLHRSVSIEATPPVHLHDLHVVADYEPATGAGALSVRVALGRPCDLPAPSGWSVRLRALGREQHQPARFEHPSSTEVNSGLFTGCGASFEERVETVAPWSAEDPVLHRLEVALIDESGAVVDSTAIEVGFRRVEVVGCELLVNGVAVLIKGVNRHDHDPVRGKAVTRESIEADLRLMKRYHLNAVRTSHYPNDPYLYDCCDRLGLYVVDEANVETHAYLRSLTKRPEVAPAVFERIVRMAVRDKNHPSVILWSLGNESGVGPVHRAAVAWLRDFDPTRPVHYESGITEDLYAALGAGEAVSMAELFARPRPESDVICPMYPSVADLVEWAESRSPDRPLIMCEYLHAMNNSCGGADEYWEAIRSHDGLQGGFVWDWVDQALIQRLEDGTVRLAYGGDFGDEPNDGPFCLNGLVAADRTPHPSLYEVARVLQPVQLSLESAGHDGATVRLRNEHGFTDLARYEARWSLLLDGEEVDAGPLGPLEVPPGAEATVRVAWPAGRGAPGPGQVAHLRLVLEGPEGTEPCVGQFELAREPYPPLEARGPATAPFDPELVVFRAPIDNETFSTGHADRFERLGLRHGGGLHLATEAVAVDGGVLVTHEVTVPESLDDLPRVGVRLRVGPGVATVEWVGRGPHESYSDRCQSADLGRYTTPVDEWGVAYVHPQANGNRTGVRRLRLLDAAGGVVAEFDRMEDLEVTVARVTDEELADAAHLEDLPVRDDCYVTIDRRQRGVGSGACGPDTSPAHRIGPGTYRWSYRVSRPGLP